MYLKFYQRYFNDQYYSTNYIKTFASSKLTVFYKIFTSTDY